MCNYTGNDFGANYPDSICIDGYLWDMDSGNADPSGAFDWLYTIGGDMPCPKCNTGCLILGHYEENQAIIDNDHMECSNCGNIVLDDYAWLIPKCDNCNQNRSI